MNETVFEKNRIFESDFIEYKKNGKSTQVNLNDLETVLFEYEKHFSKDEILFYRENALGLVKEPKNIISIIEEQNKINKNEKGGGSKFYSAFQWMKNKLYFNKEEINLDETEYQYIQDYLKENSAMMTHDNEVHLNLYKHLKINLVIRLMEMIILKMKQFLKLR